MKLTELVEKQYGIPMLPKETPYAMAFVPFQQEEPKTFSPDQGFMMGTMYQALNKPFCGGKCGDDNDEA